MGITQFLYLFHLHAWRNQGEKLFSVEAINLEIIKIHARNYYMTAKHVLY